MAGSQETCNKLTFPQVKTHFQMVSFPVYLTTLCVLQILWSVGRRTWGRCQASEVRKFESYFV